MPTIVETTKFAEEKIKAYVETEPRVAIILSALYVHVRVKTIINHHLKKQGRAFKTLYEELDFSPSIKFAFALGVIDQRDYSQMLNLAKKRNDLAHEGKLWRKDDPRLTREYQRLARDAISFLARYGSPKLILSRLPS